MAHPFSYLSHIRIKLLIDNMLMLDKSVPVSDRELGMYLQTLPSTRIDVEAEPVIYESWPEDPYQEDPHWRGLPVAGRADRQPHKHGGAWHYHDDDDGRADYGGPFGRAHDHRRP